MTIKTQKEEEEEKYNQRIKLTVLAIGITLTFFVSAILFYRNVQPEPSIVLIDNQTKSMPILDKICGNRSAVVDAGSYLLAVCFVNNTDFTQCKKIAPITYENLSDWMNCTVE